MKAIIFGCNGQDGFYLQSLLGERGTEVIGVSRNNNDYIRGNVADRLLVEQLVKKHKPDLIIHIAANSTTRHSALYENHETISTGTLNILESVYTHSKHTKVFISGSGLQFVNKGLPISEKDHFEARDAYSVARIQSVYAARYFRTLGLKVYVGYLFHHDSPLRKDNHVSKMIAEGVKRIAAGSKEQLRIGDITVMKEWAFAGDIAKGILALMEQDMFFEATIGTGKAYSIENWLECCFKFIGKDWRNHTEISRDFKPEYQVLYSDPTTIHSCGWYASTRFEELAKMMMQ